LSFSTIFFDLDETIWDYQANAEDTIIELFYSYQLERYFSLEPFKQEFFRTNGELWALFDEGKIGKTDIRTKRFAITLQRLGVDDKTISNGLQESFMEQCPQKSKVFPNADRIIDKLSQRYDLHIITNGFEDIQHRKLASSGLEHYFGSIVTSERAGAHKPERKIFEFAMNLTDASAESSIMIGDNLVADVGGALGAGMQAVYFNPESKPHSENLVHEVQDLSELAHIFL
jgi:putative hydrolase of the HAD superfamily